MAGALAVCLGLAAVSGGAKVAGQAFPQDFSKLLVTELNYHPPGTNLVDGEAFEFIELQNSGGTLLDLSGLTFHGITYTFPYPTPLGPGQFLVLARDPVRYAERYPEAPLHGIYSGKLDNAGESIRLLTTDGAVVFSFAYSDNPPWPLLADGAGHSLQRVNTSPNGSLPNNWTAAAPTPGAPIPTELIDTDGDRIPDVWEEAHGFSTIDPTDALQDPDGDGLNNYGEFAAGTNPADGADCFRFTSVSLQQTRFPTLVLTFNAVANHSYSLFAQYDMNDCWTTAATFEARATNRVETYRVGILPRRRVLYQLACPSQLPPECDGNPD
jgi:hypothetical protein